MKKAQAAMEFLMTYGWAILIVLAAIGALAYFGVLSPTKLMPERTIFKAPLANIDKAVVLSNGGAAGDGSISIAFRNNEGHTIDVTNVDTDATDSCGGSEAGATKTISVENGAFVELGQGTNGIVENGAEFVVTFVCTNAMISGQRFNSAVTLTYTNQDSLLEKPHKGMIDAVIV